MKPKHFRDPNYVKLQQIMTRKERKSRKKEFLQIKYSDPGKLLQLLEELHETEGFNIQVKVNAYLQSVTSTDMSFVIEECNRVPEASVRVIGTRILTSKLIFQVDNDFIKRLRNSEGPLEFEEYFIDPRLLETIKEILILSHSKSYRNCLIIPIYHPYKKKVIFYSGLVNYCQSDKPLAYYHGLVGECYRYCQEIVLNSMRYDEEKHFHSKYLAIMNLTVTSMAFLDNLLYLIASIKSTTLDIFAAERCYIFIVDGKTLRTRITDYGQAYDMSQQGIENIKIPVGVGIAGHVAERGKIYNCTNPSEDPLYRNDLECPIHKRSRNILTFPILLYTGVFGVIQVHDKIEACHFDSADVEFARYLGPIFGIQLHICLRKKKLWDALNRRSSIEGLFLKDNNIIDGNEVNVVMNCTKEHNYHDFYSYNFLPAGIASNELLHICLRTFEEYGLLSMYTIDRRNFIKFIIQIRNRHNSYPLHNWQHSFCRFHFLNSVVRNEELVETEKLKYMELFAMMLATLCHSMECRGGTSPYQPTTGTALASLYSTPGSLLQFYSVAQLVRIMNSKDSIITDSMDVEEYREFIKLLDQMFLFMDLSHHVANRESIAALAKSYDVNNNEHNKALQSVVLICAELNDYCKPYEYCNAFSDQTLEEFYAADTSLCTGVIDIKGFVENIQLRKVELQIHFMSDICEEAFTILRYFLPRTATCLNVVEENSQKFKSKRDAVIQHQMEAF